MISYNKKGLYEEIAALKQDYGIKQDSYGIDMVSLAKAQGIVIESLSFKTKGLRSMAVIGRTGEDDIILLNSRRTSIEQNYDCGHEVVHLSIHRDCPHKTFNCYENIMANQDHFLEWQANEGAAEFFIPYKVFIPMLADLIGTTTDYYIIEQAKKEMAAIFNVPETVIRYRLENLKYEISQYLAGKSIDDIEILSINRQRQLKIRIESINDIADKDFNNRMAEFYRLHCPAAL